MKKKFKGYEVPEVSSFRQAVRHNIFEKGDKPAFLYREKGKIHSVKYTEFYNDTICLGNAISEMGFLNKHVACIGDNCYRWVVVFFTMLHSNGVFVPIDRLLPAEDVATVLNHSDAEVIFFTKKFKDTIFGIKDKIGGVKKFICIDDVACEEYDSFDDLIARGKELKDSGYVEYEKCDRDRDALRVLVYTSGTTGMAKGVMLSENSILKDVYNGLKLTRLYDSAISILPYNHVYEAAGILAEIFCHVTIGINDNVKNILKNFAAYKPQSAYLVPAFMEAFYKQIWKKIGDKKPLIKAMISLSNGLRKCGIDVRRKMFGMILEPFGGELKKLISGGAPIRPEIADFFDAIGIDVVNGYGISECSPLISITREHYEACDTAGVPIPNTSVKIQNPDQNGIGEICVKGPHVMLGYYKNQEETNRVIVDGWFNTEDLGFIDNQGRIHVTGRAKNLIVLKNGKNVFPEEIEKYIQSIPYVAETAVTSIKDEDGSEVGLCAHIYVDPNSEEASLPNLEEILRKDVDMVCKPLPIYKQVAKIKLRQEEFVKTTSNKIKRNKIEA
ncbi:MAG: AMP-binding protein [Clostridia bacterium]|nr:AMP-binding protein [Clostridia bacterium]